MEQESKNPDDVKRSEPVSPSQEIKKMRTDLDHDVRSGAREPDQLEKLHPGDNSAKRSENKQSDSPSGTRVNQIDNRHAERWPENKVPTK